MEEFKSMWPRFGPVLLFLVLFMADIGPYFAQIWQRGADRPSAIILHSMWAGARCWIWARIKINVNKIGASSGLFGLFMADIGPFLWLT